jgi:replicative DNA helicase
MAEPALNDSLAPLLTSPDVFAAPEHAEMFRLLRQLYEHNPTYDHAAVFATFRKSEMRDDIRAVTDTIIQEGGQWAVSGAEWNAGMLAELYMKRRLLNVCWKTQRSILDGKENTAAIQARHEQELYAAGTRARSSVRSVGEAVDDVMRELSTDTSGQIVPTGLIVLDEILAGGLRRGELIIVGARPSVGKTALALTIVENAAVERGVKCLVFSLEMADQQLAMRMQCSMACVDMQKARKKILDSNEHNRMEDAAKVFATLPIWIDSTPGNSIGRIRSTARQHKRQRGLDLIVVDYIQLAEGTGDTREQVISGISRACKSMARELDVPVLALSQLNRGSDKEERPPRASDLRESGAIEQDADTIILLHRDDVAHRGDEAWYQANPDKLNIARLDVAKQRNGPCDCFKLTFVPSTAKYTNYNPGV